MLWFCLGLLLMRLIPENETRSVEIEDTSAENHRVKRQFDSWAWGFDSNEDQVRSRAGQQRQFDPDTIIFNNNDDDDNLDNRNSVLTSTTRRPPDVTPGFSTSTVAIPGMGTPRTPCEDACQTTPEYNPVCGSDSMTYFSRARLKCAEKCGKRVRLKHLGACARNG